MKRKCRYVPLSSHPLVLVLCQVRFSSVSLIADYIPGIQDDFRRHGYPRLRKATIEQLLITPGGVKVEQREQWEFRRKDQTWSIMVGSDSLVLQATTYARFEDFAETLSHALQTVLSRTENDKLGVIERVGLRYINQVRPREGEDFRTYLRPPFHGVSDTVFENGTQRLHVESIGTTRLGETLGKMIIRVIQNDEGAGLPPDLVGGAPSQGASVKPGELVTLIDMDHFVEGTFDPGAEDVVPWVVGQAYTLHDHIIETFHEQVVTPEAIAIWK